MFGDIFKDSTYDAKSLGGFASELLSNPIWQECRKVILRGIAEQMLGSAPKDAAKREDLFSQAHALLSIEAELKRLAADKTSES